MTNYMKDFGLAAHRSGYNVLPVKPGDKKPGYFNGSAWSNMPDWSRFCREPAADGTVHIWSQWPDAGVGIACGHVVAIDVDVLDEDAADDIEIVIRQHLGNTPLKRIGRAPKFLLVYRTAIPFKKMKLGPIEVLGDGQQFVAYGIHPVTGLDYTWPDDNPTDTPMGLLPPVTLEMVTHALQEAYDLLPPELQSGPRGASVPVVSARAGEGGRGTSIRGLEAHADAILSAADFIPNDDLHWEDWNRTGMALWAASQGADWGREIWFAFSAKSSKFSPGDTAERWAHYFVSPPSEIGAGTWFKIAGDNGWACPVEIDFHRGRMTEEERAELAKMVERLTESAARRRVSTEA